MRFPEPAAPQLDWAEPPEPKTTLAPGEYEPSLARAPVAGPLGFLSALMRGTLAIAEMDLRKLRHDPLELLTRAIQPVLWLLIFGRVLARVRGLSTPNLRYIDFMTPGILAQSVLFIAIFYGISIIWERDLGIVHKLLVSAAPRASLVLGKAVGAGVRGLSQAVLIYTLAIFLHVHINWNPAAVLGVAATVFLAAGCFATFSLMIACLVKTRERFMGIGQILTMPLFFASNAIYPLSLMPPWLRAVARVNPLTYEVDALRTLMIKGGGGLGTLPLDFAVLLGVFAVLAWIGARLYPRIVV